VNPTTSDIYNIQYHDEKVGLAEFARSTKKSDTQADVPVSIYRADLGHQRVALDTAMRLPLTYDCDLIALD
jgi:hypothetical protein